MNYQNPQDHFFFLDYSPSHQQLVIRSKRNKHRPYNIDILFKGVVFIDCTTELTGIEISTALESSTLKMKEKIAKRFIENYHLFFELADTNGNKNFVCASAIGIFHTDIDILETSIGRFDTAEYIHEQQYWYSIRK